MKFFNDIWTADTTNRVIEFDNISLANGISIPLCTLQQNCFTLKAINVAGQLSFRIEMFSQLTELGFEIYNLLKDQLDIVPQEYCNEVLKYNNTRQDISFEFQSLISIIESIIL